MKISLLYTIYKVYESLFRNSLTNEEKFNVEPLENEYDFRTGHSIINALNVKNKFNRAHWNIKAAS